MAEALKGIAIDELETISPFTMTPWENCVQTITNESMTIHWNAEYDVCIAISSSARNSLVSSSQHVIKRPSSRTDSLYSSLDSNKSATSTSPLEHYIRTGTQLQYNGFLRVKRASSRKSRREWRNILIDKALPRKPKRPGRDRPPSTEHSLREALAITCQTKLELIPREST